MLKIKTILFLSVAAVLLFGIIGFTTVKSGSKRVRDVQVNILDQDGNYFTDKQEVLNLINNNNTDYVLSLSLSQIDLKTLEMQVESHPFIKQAEVYHDIKGNLIVKVEQAKPIARIFNPKGPDQYIDEEGFLLPTSQKHTARVPIIEIERGFSWKENITELEYGQKILELLQFVQQDEFWRAQIAQLVIDKKGEITFLPQVSKQEVVFGMPEDIESKFRKLKIFYKEILPNKGWNTYTAVNLKFKNQIVCE